MHLKNEKLYVDEGGNEMKSGGDAAEQIQKVCMTVCKSDHVPVDWMK